MKSIFSQIQLALSVGEKDLITIAIYDITGQRLITLLNNQLEEGKHHISWDGKTASGSMIKPGMYFVRMVGSTSIQNKTIVIME